MMKASCQLNLTLEPPVSDHVERIAREAYTRAGGAGRTLLMQRLALESAGWKIQDESWGRLLEAVCRLSKEGIEDLGSVIRGLGPDNKPDHRD